VPRAPNRPSTVLGMAVPLASRGLHVVVYDDHVRKVAAQRAKPYGLILPYVIAHEIGHVLLRSNSHVPVGMMASQWMDTEYALIAQGTLLFPRSQSSTMRASIEALGCSNPTK
jgi:hypothetical protein